MKTLLLTVILLATPVIAAAQEQDPGRGGRGNRPRSEGLAPAAVQDMIDSYALMQAQEHLRLKDEQYADFITRLRNLQQTRRRNLRQRNQLLMELNRMTAPKAPPAEEAALREKLKALRDHDERAADEMRKAYDTLDEILDARQQARFRLFEENLDRRKLDLLMRARQGAAAKGTGPGGAR